MKDFNYDNYEKQGRDFLKKYGLQIDFLYLGCKPYFDGDTESRDVWQFVIRPVDWREKRTFSGRFGDSINNTVANAAANGYYRKKPTAYAILSSLSMDIQCPDTFEDFCAEYGFDRDSRRAERVFKNASKFAKRLRGFFTDEEKADLVEIQ